MLQIIGRVATPKLVSRNCLRHFQATLITGEGIGLRIYVRYCLKKSIKSKRAFWKTWHFFWLTLTIFDVWDIPSGFMINWGTPWSLWSSEKNWSVEAMGKYNELLSLKTNFLRIKSVLFSRHAIQLEHQ